MPMPQEYQRASEEFAAFLADARDELGQATRNQAYTSVQAVLLVFRDRLTPEQVLCFAAALPAVLRALFVADWWASERPLPFGERSMMTREVQSHRRDHNFSPDTVIADVARAMRRHTDAGRFAEALSRLPRAATDFWS